LLTDSLVEQLQELDARIAVGGELTQKLIQLLIDSTSTNKLLKEKLALSPRMLKAMQSIDQKSCCSLGSTLMKDLSIF
jgi:hypothetical protein